MLIARPSTSHASVDPRHDLTTLRLELVVLGWTIDGVGKLADDLAQSTAAGATNMEDTTLPTREVENLTIRGERTPDNRSVPGGKVQMFASEVECAMSWVHGGSQLRHFSPVVLYFTL